MKQKLVPISKARATLASLIEDAQTMPVFLLRHGQARAVLISADVYNETMERLEDLEDTLAGLYAEGDTIPFVPTANREHASA